MQYMLLIYTAPDAEPIYGSPEFQAMMQGFSAFNERANADGVLRGGEALKGIETATSLRLRSGKVETMDGPFAAMLPVAAWGTIEVRPLMDYNPANT